MGPPSHLAPLKKARSVVFEREKIETVLFSILFYIWKHYRLRCFVSEDRLPRIMVFPNRLVPIDQWPSQFKTSPEPHSEHILRKCQFFPFVFFVLYPSQQKYKETKEYIIFFFEAWLTILGKRTLQSLLISSQGQYTFTQYWLDGTIFCVTHMIYHDSWVMTSSMVVCHIVNKVTFLPNFHFDKESFCVWKTIKHFCLSLLHKIDAPAFNMVVNIDTFSNPCFVLQE